MKFIKIYIFLLLFLFGTNISAETRIDLSETNLPREVTLVRRLQTESYNDDFTFFNFLKGIQTTIHIEGKDEEDRFRVLVTKNEHNVLSLKEASSIKGKKKIMLNITPSNENGDSDELIFTVKSEQGAIVAIWTSLHVNNPQKCRIL